jgi:hypothetical protein
MAIPTCIAPTNVCVCVCDWLCSKDHFGEGPPPNTDIKLIKAAINTIQTAIFQAALGMQKSKGISGEAGHGYLRLVPDGPGQHRLMATELHSSIALCFAGRVGLIKSQSSLVVAGLPQAFGSHEIHVDGNDCCSSACDWLNPAWLVQAIKEEEGANLEMKTFELEVPVPYITLCLHIILHLGVYSSCMLLQC